MLMKIESSLKDIALCNNVICNSLGKKGRVERLKDKGKKDEGERGKRLSGKG